MKNKIPLMVGFLTALLLILLISGILQYLIVHLLGITIEGVTFSSSGLTPIFNVNSEDNIFFNSLLIFSKLLILISLLELGLLLLSKFPIGIYRFATISSVLFFVGYLILSFFYGIISTLVLSDSNSNFVKLIKLLELEGNQSFALIFFLLIIFVGYLHLVQKRVLQYLNVDE